ncbi:MAG: adenosylmethionine decarboxylase [Desulfobacterales bacterium]|nr:adenosylmethionine decarboxylase [Desulfobacterales bacterium]
MFDKNRKFAGDFKGDTSFALGRQLTIEYYNCAANILLNKDIVEKALLKAANDSGATIISSSFHDFQPQGVSGVVIIAESHFTVHAWPEHDYAAVDIFTCGDSIDLEVAINSMKDSFQSENVVISSDQNRGIIPKSFEEKKEGENRTIKGLLNNPRINPISWGKEYEKKNPWGVLTSVDIAGCSPDIIRDAKRIEQFVQQLCDLIGMKRFGECNIVHFGEDKKVEGFSMTQLIETSLISGHFANASNRVYLDIFSCKFYEPREVAEFATAFFKGDNYKMQIALRQ